MTFGRNHRQQTVFCHKIFKTGQGKCWRFLCRSVKCCLGGCQWSATFRSLQSKLSPRHSCIVQAACIFRNNDWFWVCSLIIAANIYFFSFFFTALPDHVAGSFTPTLLMPGNWCWTQNPLHCSPWILLLLLYSMFPLSSACVIFLSLALSLSSSSLSPPPPNWWSQGMADTETESGSARGFCLLKGSFSSPFSPMGYSVCFALEPVSVSGFFVFYV